MRAPALAGLAVMLGLVQHELLLCQPGLRCARSARHKHSKLWGRVYVVTPVTLRYSSSSSTGTAVAPPHHRGAWMQRLSRQASWASAARARPLPASQLRDGRCRNRRRNARLVERSQRDDSHAASLASKRGTGGHRLEGRASEQQPTGVAATQAFEPVLPASL